MFNIHYLSPALIIFIRNPVLGKVKTRLAAGAGNEEALNIYKELLRHTRETASAVACTRYVFYSDFIDEQDEWPQTLFNKRLQQGTGLGEKMLLAFKEVLPNHSRAVIIGSDCYTLRTRHIETALEQLNSHDTVIGPAEDGGYYLLGMKQLLPFLFEAIQWSTAKVLAQTLARVKENNITVQLLEPLHDVDTLADWQKVTSK